MHLTKCIKKLSLVQYTKAQNDYFVQDSSVWACMDFWISKSLKYHALFN